MLRRPSVVGFALLLGFVTSDVRADTIIYEGWPPPGGASAAASGPQENIGEAAGFSWTYTGLDTTEYDSLWWGISAAPQIRMSSSLNPNLLYSGVSNNTLFFSGSNMLLDVFGTPYYFDTRLRVTAVDAADSPLAWISSPTGLVGAYGGHVLDVPGANHDEQFKISYFAEALYQGYWQPVNVVFNTFHTYDGDKVNTSVSSGFWYTEESAVPAPSSLIGLLSLGATGLVMKFRRKKERA